LESLGNEISRAELENQVATTYIQQDARAWFVSTFCGMISVCAQAHNFNQIVVEDRSADDAMKDRINQWLDEQLKNYALTLGVEGKLKQARSKMKREWFAHYAEIDSFRTSLPSQTVWDVDEKGRERDWCYEADVKTLLTRAERLWFNDKHQRLYVQGYQGWHYVWFNKSFEDMADCVGTIQTTANFPYNEMQFMQEGHLTSVSHVMQRPKHHIFVFAPYEIKDQIDWRIAWFRCGSQGCYLIAFDGDALLLKEIYDRSLVNNN